MRFAAMLGIVLGITLVHPGPAVLADTEPSILPGHGAVVPLAEAPTEILVHYPGDAPRIRVIDEDAAEVPGRIEPRGVGQSAFVPDASPLPAGQYTVELTSHGECFTFTVGPDVYAPRAVSLAPDEIGRETAVSITFTEPLDPSTVDAESVRVYERTDSGTRDVPGTVSLDPTGTTIVFTPEGWPGFAPEGSFGIELDAKIEDLSGNDVSDVPLIVTTDEEDIGDIPDLPRVPESVFWASRRDIGVLDLALRDRGTFDSKDVVPHTIRPGIRVAVGDPDELVIGPRVNARGEGWVYGVDPREDRVVGFETATGRVYELPVPRVKGIAIDPAGKHLYVASRHERGGSHIETLLIDGKYPHHSAEGTVDLPFRREEYWAYLSTSRHGATTALAVSPDGALVASLLPRLRAIVLRYPDRSGGFVYCETGARPRDLTYVERPGGEPLLLVTCRGTRTRSGKVLVLDGLTGTLLGELTGFKKPRRITARGQRAWVAEYGAKRVTAIDVPDVGLPTKGPSFYAGPKPSDVAIAPDDSGRLFVVNRRFSRITVLDGTTGEVLEKIRAPGAVAVSAWGEN